MNSDLVEENVKVAVRCRPLIDIEKDDICVKIDDNYQTLTIEDRQFTFDRVFGFESKQLDIYTQSAKQIVDSVLHGYNGTIFAYGQTGTGKTYTATGILTHAFVHLFGFISKSSNDKQFLVRASYYEIYNEEIRDLLAKDNKALELKESANGIYVKDLSCYVVNNVAELEKLKDIGNKKRQVAATNMNRHSSRSHTVFSITVEMITDNKSKLKNSLKVGKLHLVDLAGSERQSKAGTSGTRLKEAAKINLSLTSLSLVIAALTDPKATHVPYRNSKLTRLLSDSLGGNSKTLLIACIGPAKINLDESISTLRFASTAKHIKNTAKVNEDAKDALLRKFQDQISELRKQLDETQFEDENDKIQKLSEEELKANGEMIEKLKALENKVIIGGENLLEKAELQEKLLAESEAEIKKQKDKEIELQNALNKEQAEILQIEESYGTLQEEIVGVNKKLKKVFSILKSSKSELIDVGREYAKLREDIIETIRATQKEIYLADFIIQKYIPEDYVELIEYSSKYNEHVGEWQLECIAFTNNNLIDKYSNDEEKKKNNEGYDLEKFYLRYND